MAVDAHDGKGHAREVAEGVAHKDARGVPVVAEQSQGGPEEGQDEGHGEEELLGGLGLEVDLRRPAVRGRPRSREVEGVGGSGADAGAEERERERET